jgi:hypothetical protein
MIQYYINNRPVPRAIARQYLAEGIFNPLFNISDLLSRAANDDKKAIKFCAAYGVSIAKI